MAPVQIIAIILSATVASVFGQADNLGLGGGYTTITSDSFSARIVKNSQTLASLQPRSNTAFDFLPFDFLSRRAYNGAHHIGDVTLRYRNTGGTSWTTADSAAARAPVTALNSLAPGVVAGANLAPTLPSNIPLRVTREWLTVGGDVAMRFNITNTGSSSVEIGSLGFPIHINNIFVQRTAADVRTKCSLADPYVGLDAGYVRVSPVGGVGNGLAITPFGKSPFEAWRFLTEPSGSLGYQIQTFEGSYEWQVHTRAYADNEWRGATPWNSATSKTLAAGEMYSVGLRLALSSSISTIEDAVTKTGTPLAVGLPGYVVPTDNPALLYLTHTAAVSSINTDGAFTSATVSDKVYRLTPSGSRWGRARVTITYADGKVQTVHYYIVKSAPDAIGDMGNFLTTRQYFTDTSDPFGRAPSVITYDREVNKPVVQDTRVWISGLSDEGGAGSYVSALMKQAIQPVATEVTLLDNFVHQTLWDTIQANGNYGVRASVFFYEPGATSFRYDTSQDWTSWTSWNRARAYTTRRAYNYVHPTAAYWAMYRVARNYPSIKTQSPWTWYLDQAYKTIQYCLSNNGANCDYADVGLMGETVVGELLTDLQREGNTTAATALEATMRRRAQLWDTQSDPYGSEMGWDSTGQEGVYYWSKYFGFSNTAQKTFNSINGYMPTVAHWGWNGNARRYWDFIYGGKLRRYERQIHHYGSGLNALPLLSAYESSPTSLYTLRVGYAGTSAPLSNIDQEGFAAAAFHSWPETLRWDAYSGDYGPNFLGLALGSGTYIVNDSKYGRQAFGGNLEVSGSTVTVRPRDATRRKVFIAPLGLKIELAAGAIESVSYTDSGSSTSSVTLTIAQAVNSRAAKATSAVVWLKEPAQPRGTVRWEVQGGTKARGGWTVNLGQANGNSVVVRRV